MSQELTAQLEAIKQLLPECRDLELSTPDDPDSRLLATMWSEHLQAWMPGGMWVTTELLKEPQVIAASLRHGLAEYEASQ